ncbi:hypothetical protein P872_08490 [Rhodonellum psychrophilum GCM71 = DSM 17998]|uniref:Uncharacterized protein n=1 Tax=Rhodonellum psychrophilum GCM71 = DSM 17998 TaxID=1123057 RepID=U5BW45_9BACT|nr:hypothetical protein P872_08490 [Rhodonellum psychrophilum GCM71 = DSM 17998]
MPISGLRLEKCRGNHIIMSFQVRVENKRIALITIRI